MNSSNRHTIRLWGPWQMRVQSSDDPPVIDRRINLRAGSPPNSDWRSEVPDGFAGSVSLTRQFNCPTGIGERHRILFELGWLSDELDVEIRFNDAIELGHLVSASTAEWELNLRPGGNRIELLMEASTEQISSLVMPPFSSANLHIEE